MKEQGGGWRAFIAGAACGSPAFAGGAALFNPTNARAQGAELAWPNRPVRFIVPPEQLATVVQSGSAKYARLVKELNIRANQIRMP
jgi:hypothetical protein